MTMRTLLVLALCTMAFSAFAAGAPAAVPTVTVVVPVGDVARGDVLTEADFTTAQVPAASVTAGVVRNASDLAGQEARRYLHAGEMVRLSDVKHPTVVAKGSTVTMTFAAPGLMLVATGRALSEGGVGDTISVQNPVSYRQVQAVVTGPGQAQVGSNQAAAAQAQDVSASSRLAAAQP